MIGNVRITTPIDDDDKTYEKQFFRTSIDVEKLLKGVQGNFVMKVFLENFFQSIDFEPKFPMKKVRIKYFLENTKENNSRGSTELRTSQLLIDLSHFQYPRRALLRSA